MLLSGLSLVLLFATAGLVAQNPFQSGTKYRTHFVTYDVQKKTTTTLFTIEGEWHPCYRRLHTGACRRRRSDEVAACRNRASNQLAFFTDGPGLLFDLRSLHVVRFHCGSSLAKSRSRRGVRVTGAVHAEGLSHHFGVGRLRKQILYDLSLDVGQGEIVILTGPSGSGKTALLSLVWALRTVQAGQLTVLGNSISGASEGQLDEIRRKMGFIFQANNLNRSLSAVQNVSMGLEVQQSVPRLEREQRAMVMLEHIGMGEHGPKFPEELSGGQKATGTVVDPAILQRSYRHWDGP